METLKEHDELNVSPFEMGLVSSETESLQVTCGKEQVARVVKTKGTCKYNGALSCIFTVMLHTLLY